MTVAALPSLYEFDSPMSNLAAFPEEERVLYRAWDGTPLDYGSSCAPLGAEHDLSGFMVPDILEESRLEWGQQWALPALVAAAVHSSGSSLLATALWGLAAYMAPLPVAGLGVYRALRR